MRGPSTVNNMKVWLLRTTGSISPNAKICKTAARCQQSAHSADAFARSKPMTGCKHHEYDRGGADIYAAPLRVPVFA